MLTGITHTAVLALGLMLIALVKACGDTQPLPDIAATVVAFEDLVRAERERGEAREKIYRATA